MSEKNIPAILGSPHSNGMTAAMLDCAILKAEKVGYIVTKINLYEKNLSYCKGCRACMKTQTCIQKDDIQEIVHLILCGDTVLFDNGLLLEALSRLPEQDREMVYLSFFKHIPQHEIGRRYGRSRSAAGYHIRKVIRQLYEEMEGMAHEE